MIKHIKFFGKQTRKIFSEEKVLEDGRDLYNKVHNRETFCNARIVIKWDTVWVSVYFKGEGDRLCWTDYELEELGIGWRVVKV